MRYTGLELFMEKLNQMIYRNDNPLVNNHPSILSQRPQFRMLYEEVDMVIHLINEYYHYRELQLQVRDVKKRFKDAVENAHDIIDLFVYHINMGNLISLNPEDAMRSIKCIKDEFMNMINNNNMKMTVSSPRVDRVCYTKSPLGTKKAYEEIVVGFDRHAKLVRDKLVEDQKQLDVVSIVGMGGLGKTTLATKVFNDPFVVYHFYVRGWVTVSQTYEKKDLLIQILESIGIELDKTVRESYSGLREKLHKTLMGRRYLIVIDDIWTSEAWDDLKLFFPNNHTQSRLLLTSRLKDVASHAKSHGFIHHLEYLTQEESWELLRKKVFHGCNDCPEWLFEPGMKIAKNCHGLPLTLVVIAGVLAKEELSKDSWERIGQSVSSYVVRGQTEYKDQLALSFDHLRGHLRDCFLYLGGFPEDHKFRVQRLIWLWMAEGFIQEDGIRSVEEIGEDCVMELVDRNLVVVADRKSNGGIKEFYVHDLLRELCMEIAIKENFYLKAQRAMHSVEACNYNQRRLFIEDTIIRYTPRIRSLLCVYGFNITRNLISKCSGFWMLLMVLDLLCGRLSYFPEEISQFVHLRYLAICFSGCLDLPSSISKLWSLETLVIRSGRLQLPKTISNLVNLRHLKSEGAGCIVFPAVDKPMNLQTLSIAELGYGDQTWVKCLPCLKKLSCEIQSYNEYDLKSLNSLENLRILRSYSCLIMELKVIELPVSLKSLTLKGCDVSGSEMSRIQALLPKLEVLKLVRSSFQGLRWDAGQDQFRQLKVLKLSQLEIKDWEASSINFPSLKQLVVDRCYELEEIPLDLGCIPTLGFISICGCKESAIESLQTIQEEQHAQENFDLKISVKKYEYRWRYGVEPKEMDTSS